jgi:hypothetical protein
MKILSSNLISAEAGELEIGILQLEMVEERGNEPLSTKYERRPFRIGVRAIQRIRGCVHSRNSIPAIGGSGSIGF